jgi:hypothetical protein
LRYPDETGSIHSIRSLKLFDQPQPARINTNESTIRD